MSKLKVQMKSKVQISKNDGIVKSRHSRENGNPENSNYMKILDSCLRPPGQRPYGLAAGMTDNGLFRLFTRPSKINLIFNHLALI